MKTNILRYPILSEKAYKLMEKGAYSFFVDERANKETVRRVVSGQFGVDVVRVNIARSFPKQVRIKRTRKFASTGGGKKAIVWLVPGQTIPMLSPKTESKKTTKIKTEVKKDDA